MNTLNQSNSINQENNSMHQTINRISAPYREWLGVSGDVDDFIFFDNYKTVSDK